MEIKHHVCAWCGRIKIDNAYTDDFATDEVFHNRETSHGICKKCRDKCFDEYVKRVK